VKGFLSTATGDSSLGVKLALSFGLLILIMGCLGLLGLRYVRVDTELEKTVDARLYKAQLSRNALAASNLNNRITMQLFLIEDENEINSLLIQRARNTEKISTLIKTLGNKVESSEEGQLLDGIEKSRTPYVESYQRALHLLVVDKKPVEARAVMVQEALPRLLRYHAAWNAYVDYQGDQLNQAQNAASASHFRSHIEVFSLISLAMVLAVAIAFFVTRNLTRHLARRKLAEEALRQTHGELEMKVRERTSQLAATNEELQEEIKARKLIEDELRNAEDRCRRIVDSAKDMIYRLTPAGHLTFVNPAGAATVKRSVEESVGIHFWSLIRKDFRENAIEFYQQQVREKIPVTYFEFPVIAKDGTEIWVGQNVQLEIEDGVVVELQAVGRDITTGKELEARLLESERRYRLLFESNPLPLWVYDSETRALLAVNNAAIDQYGYSRDEFLAMSIFEIRPPEDVPALLNTVAELDEGGDNTGIWRHRKKDGSIIDVEITSHTLEFAGRPARIVLAVDITERKRMEAERQVMFEIIQGVIATDNLEGLLELIHHSIGKLTYADNCFVALHDPATDLMHFEFWVDKLDPCPPPRPPGIGFSGYVLRTGQSLLLNRELAERMYRSGEVEKSGSPSASWLGVPLRTHSRTIGVLVVQHYEDEHAYGERDLEFLESVGNQVAIAIDRKRAETSLRATEEQLRQSQKMESIGTLAGGIAHDFNNLLTAINGYSELALRKLEADHPVRSKIEEIKKAGERAAALTRQLLAFSRKQLLQPRVLDLNSVVTGMGKMLPRMIGEDIDLRIELDSSLGQVKADPGQIEQVILNLAVNARDAMLDGGYLTIKTGNVHFDRKLSKRRLVVEPGHYVMLSVSDNGCGMDAETRTHIFEPFFTTKEVGKGTGLGLSTAYGIVKQSGGSVWVYSEVGLGTTFKIYLPRVDEVLEVEESSEDSRAVGRGNETILLVEDEDMVRDLSKEILEAYGYSVIAAPNGQEGLRICKEFEGPIDLMITDVVMPQMSGRELAENIGTLRPDTRVLYMSGFTNDAVVRHGVLDDGMCFIQKPFSPDSLALKAREVLNQAEAR
jgi:PAS domain S-box-containing protein